MMTHRFILLFFWLMQLVPLAAQDCNCNLNNDQGRPSWKNGGHQENAFRGTFYRFYKPGEAGKEGCWLVSEETFRNLPKNGDGKPCPQEVQKLLALAYCPDHCVRIKIAEPVEMFEGVAASWANYGFPSVYGGAWQYCAAKWLPQHYFDHGAVETISEEGCQ